MLLETVKSFFKPRKKINQSSNVNPDNVINNLSDDNGYLRLTDFFDYQEDNNCFSTFSDMTQEELCLKQMTKLRNYRQCAMQPDVSNAIDIIVNEIIFSYEKNPLKLVVDVDNNQLKEALQKAFDKILTLGNFDKNLFDVVKKTYIDGQIVIHCAYDDKAVKKGIQKLRMIDPAGLYFDYKEKQWKYLDYMPNMLYASGQVNEKYSQEEIVRVDFGLYEDWICLSYLEYAIKDANILKSLEDLLLPLRFGRSISRRVFNVDVGELPNKRADEYMKKVQDKFKYKKFYNNETGEISNQQHITSMVEDYWFAKRSNGKGTEVTTLEETRNLGELGDIVYMAKKLYRALNIPTSKLDIDPDSNHSFNIDPTETTQEDMRFMMFISRIRKVYTQIFKELLKRQAISTGVMSDKEWNLVSNSINVEFTNENLFIEKMKIDLLKSKIESWESVKTIGGTVFSFSELIQRVFGLSQEEIETNFKDIKKEMKNDKYSIFYKLADIEIGVETGMSGMTDANGNPVDAEDMTAGIFTDKDSDEDSEDSEDSDSEKSEDSDSEEHEDSSKSDHDVLKKYGIDF